MVATSSYAVHGSCALEIDRHNTYRELNGFYFPHFEDPRKPLRSTIVDGELVIDVDPRTRQVCTFSLPPGML